MSSHVGQRYLDGSEEHTSQEPGIFTRQNRNSVEVSVTFAQSRNLRGRDDEVMFDQQQTVSSRRDAKNKVIPQASIMARLGQKWGRGFKGLHVTDSGR